MAPPFPIASQNVEQTAQRQRIFFRGGSKKHARSNARWHSEFSDTGSRADLQRANPDWDHLVTRYGNFVDWIRGHARLDCAYHLRVVRILIRQRSSCAGVVSEARPLGRATLNTLSYELSASELALPHSRAFRHDHSFKKFSRIILPCGCSSSKSSGWNCTPNSGREVCCIA